MKMISVQFLHNYTIHAYINTWHNLQYQLPHVQTFLVMSVAPHERFNSTSTIEQCLETVVSFSK